MVTGRWRAKLQRLIVVVGLLLKVAQSCPELRQCFPEAVVTVPCQNDPTLEWTSEPSDIDCSIYVSCFNAIGIKMCCPDGMLFNPDTLKCDDESNVDCQIEPPPCPQTTTTTMPDTTTALADTTTNDADTTMVTNPAETTTDLSTGETSTTTDETDTTTQPITTTEEITSTAAIDTTTVQQGPDLVALCAALSTDSLVELAYPGECSSYIVCLDRQYIATEVCPAGLHHNPILSVCDSPDQAECLDYICQNNPEGSPINIASINSCQRYYICIGNMTVERFCAPGTIYDAENGWCIVEDMDNPCVRERLPAPPQGVILQCTGESELIKIRHPTMCDVYYRCLNGRLWARQCPAGLYFDTDRAQCNLAEVVSCEVQQ
ncbi:uncharacterized protein LOC120900803 [Anopheles arabiensis]|nr:uncharacterized protein LOC120900803 [Anopheles arabiensis]